MQHRKQTFNMIEVVLGIGMIAVGLVAVLSLIPVGMKADRNAVLNTLATYNAEQFMYFLSMRLKDPDGDYENWDDYGRCLPTSKPGPAEPTSGWDNWIDEGTARYDVGGSDNQFYRAEQESSEMGDPEFTAVYRVWRTRVTLTTYDGSWHTQDLSYDQAMTIHTEISWPAYMPYAQRRKALYQIEVYKQ